MANTSFFLKFKKYSLKKEKVRPELEAHEILFYAEKQRRAAGSEDFWEERLELPLRRAVFAAIFAVAFGVLFLLLCRLAYLGILEREYYFSLAKSTQENLHTLHAPRGIVYAQDGEVLAKNKKIFNVLLDKKISEVLSGEDLVILSEIIDVSKVDLETRIKESKEKIVLLKSNISQDASLRITANFNPVSGIRVEPAYIREYQDPYAFSHVIGYTGYVEEGDLLKNTKLFAQDRIGKSGIELAYDEYIRGENGEIIARINSKNEFLGEANIKEPLPGKDIVLTIDSELQKKIYDAFRESRIERGAAVALNPNTGEVLALVSVPGFDINMFASWIDPKVFQGIISDSGKPFFPRAISGQYPPGSTIKPFIGLSALEEGIISPQKYIYAEGAIYVPNIYNPEIVYKFTDWKEHGYVNMVKAIAVSSNVYFYHVGGGFGDIKGLGIEKIDEYLKRFGLGNILGIDIAGEAAGLIPGPSWKKDTKGEDWYIGDTYNASIGQGDVSVTPLQLAASTAALANYGILWRPHLVRKILNSDGSVYKQNYPEKISDYNASYSNFDVIREGMREAVMSGSSKSLSGLSVAVAGKTGTAQVGENKDPHAWWTGFAPYENPEIVLTILVENGGEGSAVAVPIAKEVLGWYFSDR